jgi:hypothetical protein
VFLLWSTRVALIDIIIECVLLCYFWQMRIFSLIFCDFVKNENCHLPTHILLRPFCLNKRNSCILLIRLIFALKLLVYQWYKIIETKILFFARVFEPVAFWLADTFSGFTVISSGQMSLFMLHVYELFILCWWLLPRSGLEPAKIIKSVPYTNYPSRHYTFNNITWVIIFLFLFERMEN